MKKAVITLNIGGTYEPNITDMTYPFMRYWADKIRADFVEITERRFPDWPPAYEKLQVADLGKGYDWTIFLDADTLWYPDNPDWTDLVRKDTVIHYGWDFSSLRFLADPYFLRDGRHVGTPGWCTMASDWVRDDLYTPLNMPPEVAASRISPIVAEAQRRITAEHLLDDYTLSRNIARFGLRVETVQNLSQTNKLGGQWAFHNFFLDAEDKVLAMRALLGGEAELRRILIGDREEMGIEEAQEINDKVERIKNAVLTLGQRKELGDREMPGWHVPVDLLNRRTRGPIVLKNG